MQCMKERVPRTTSCLSSRLRGYVTIGYIERRTQYVGNWSPRECLQYGIKSESPVPVLGHVERLHSF